jgi:hypothetical protein
MADIYTNAYLTIAATASKDGNGGCFSRENSSIGDRKMRSSVLRVAEYDMQKDDYFRGFGQPHNQGRRPSDFPLLNRAWVYQERTLSARVIHFTHDELVWECNSMMRSESGEIDEEWTLDSYKDDSGHSAPFKYQFTDQRYAWHKIATSYSGLQMTFPKDRLPALGAIVQRMMRRRFDDVYVAGIWKKTLLEDLKWMADPCESLTYPRPATNIPSWSWASVNAKTIYPIPQKAKTYTENSLGHLLSRCKASVTFSAVGPPQLGNVANATILLQSRSYTGLIQWSYDPEIADKSQEYMFCIAPQHSDFNTIPLVQYWNMFPDYNLFTGQKPIRWDEEVHIVMFEVSRYRIGSVSEMSISLEGLVLRKASGETFERIGLCEFGLMRDVSYVHRQATLRDNFEWRYVRQFLSSLPVRSYEIV